MNSQPYLYCNSCKYFSCSLAFKVGLLLFNMCISSVLLLPLTGLLLLSLWLSVVVSNGINFCIGLWHTVFSPVWDIATTSAPLAWAFFSITNLFIIQYAIECDENFFSPLISTIHRTFKTLFFECFSFLFMSCCCSLFKYSFKTFSTDHSLALRYICNVY